MHDEPLTQPTPASRIARALLDGFDRHYRLFSEVGRGAKQRFEQADWHGQRKAMRERIEFYDQRVLETRSRLLTEFAADALSLDVWQQTKLLYIGLLIDHRQPELAETFFNSVTTKILHRSYFHNDFIFVRPAISTSYIELDEPAGSTYRVYYPVLATWRDTWVQVVRDFDLRVEFEDLERDATDVASALESRLGRSPPGANFQVQVLANLFFRNKAAYVIGKIINGYQQTPVALPLLHVSRGKLAIDTVLDTEDDLRMLFSYARAYFLVDMPVPSAYIQFLRSLMPGKPRAEIYSAVGLHKQGKNSFYRDLLAHLRHSRGPLPHRAGHQGHGHAGLRPAVVPLRLQGHQGLLSRAEEHDAREDQGQVPAGEAARPRGPHGRHPRVQQGGAAARALRAGAGRRDATVLLQPARVHRDRRRAGSRHRSRVHRAPHDAAQPVPEERGGRRRDRSDRARDDRVRQRDQGSGRRRHLPGRHAVEELRHDAAGPHRVLRLRRDRIPERMQLPARTAPRRRRADSDELWFDVGPKDVFPETFGRFLLGNARVRSAFLAHHADLLDADYWNLHKQRILAGAMLDIFPYDPRRRFVNRRAAARTAEGAAPA